ncbi:hypothetical protein E3N88_20775 [Mikania micrantha]|uniref:Uncharacterized protein n=1 Tax=Mikania micrantha TaxID=192012 RepID=A0A5N6NI14_9ASTR|nr:hypothetical protein E3N88_20775 [Mikania micrantha]
MWISMWWDCVWVGCRLDPFICPIYKHTDLDITCDVNEVKVVIQEFNKCFMCVFRTMMETELNGDSNPGWVTSWEVFTRATKSKAVSYDLAKRTILLVKRGGVLQNGIRATPVPFGMWGKPHPGR